MNLRIRFDIFFEKRLFFLDFLPQLLLYFTEVSQVNKYQLACL